MSCFQYCADSEQSVSCEDEKFNYIEKKLQPWVVQEEIPELDEQVKMGGVNAH